MKKFVSLILTVCFIFLAANTIWPADARSEEKTGTILSLSSVSDFTSKLESENVDIADSSAYEISVLIELDDIVSSEGFNFDTRNILTDSTEIDSELESHRNRVKEYYVEYNEKIASTLGLNDYEYYVSYYSPYIEIIFDDLDEYSRCENALISSISNPDIVLSACSTVLISDYSDEATYDSSFCSTDYILTDAFEDIGVSASTYTGNGIKVGIIDGGVPYTDNLKSGKYTMITTTRGMHSTVIASIIGGTSGIAENVYFYCMAETGSLVYDCNLMINTYGVNIINMSLRDANVGYYTNYDAYIDNVVSNTGCTFVKSAGNRGHYQYNYDRLVTAPGCSLNAITVGSVNRNGNVSVFSSWVVSDSFLYKPDVVAPGERLWDIPNIPNVDAAGNEGHSGTSYAAPMVVGTIALLMEEFPVLKTNPALVKSVLHLGAEKLPSQTSYFDQQAGFGLLNYQNMRACLLNSNYSDFIIPSNAKDGDIVSSYATTIPYGYQICINANSMINSNINVESSIRNTPVYTNYTIKIYDLAALEYVAVSNINSSVDYLLFTNADETNSDFRIDIVLETDNESGEDELCSFAYELTHATHSYTHRYIWQSDTQHGCLCECGDQIMGSHVVKQGAFNGTSEYAICLLCKGRVFMGNLNSIISDRPHTSNGSYILPNGVIVLVEDDIEAYMNGSLAFFSGETE